MKILKNLDWKRLFLSLLLTVLIVYLFSPKYISQQLKINSDNNKSMVVVYNDGFQKNAIKLLSQHKDAVLGPCTKNGNACSGYVIKEEISKDWKNYEFQFEVVGDGTVYVDLRSPQGKKIDNVQKDPMVDYRNFVINGITIFSDAHPYYFNSTYQKLFNAKNGDIIKVNIDIKKHGFDFADIYKLKLFAILVLAFLFSYLMFGKILKR